VAELVRKRLSRPAGGVNAENLSVGGSWRSSTSGSIDFSVMYAPVCSYGPDAGTVPIARRLDLLWAAIRTGEFTAP
jgi:hypothetical protein